MPACELSSNSITTALVRRTLSSIATVVAADDEDEARVTPRSDAPSAGTTSAGSGSVEQAPLDAEALLSAGMVLGAGSTGVTPRGGMDPACSETSSSSSMRPKQQEKQLRGRVQAVSQASQPFLAAAGGG